MVYKPLTRLFICLLALLFLPPLASADDIDMDIILSPLLANAQSLSMASLGIEQDGTGPLLFTVVMARNSTDEWPNICMRVIISNGNDEPLAIITTDPFTIPANVVQLVADNRDLVSGSIDEIPENFDASAELTPVGEELVNELDGQPELPVDIYTIFISMYRCDDEYVLGQTMVQIGGSTLNNPVDFIPLTPGDMIGSGAVIETTLPYFDWDGDAQQYRLIVAMAGEEDPEVILGNALDTPPDAMLNSDEMLDTILPIANYAYPPSGVQPLIPGQTYYWQVFGAVVSPEQEIEYIPAPIMEFTVADDSSEDNTARNSMILQLLRDIFGDAFVNQYGLNGYDLDTLTINGETYTENTIIPALLEIQQNLNAGNLTITQINLQ